MSPTSPSEPNSETPAVPLTPPGRVRRKRRSRFTRFAVTGVTVVLALLAVRQTVAKAHRIALAPLPLAYAFTQSPNCDNRPQFAAIDCIVLHSTVEATTEGTMGIFLDPRKKVSAHFIVGKDGRVVQMVPVERRAWHAGNSVLDGVSRVNDFSVGIEMVNLNDGVDPYTPAQLEAVAGLIRFIRSKYNVPDERIVSHAQIALPAGRKSDPAGFDFEKIRAMARLGAPEQIDPPAHSQMQPTAIDNNWDTNPVRKP